MHILMVLPTAFPGNRGTPARVYEMIRVLAAGGVATSVVCYNDGHGRPTAADIYRIPRLPFYKNGIGPSYSRLILDLFLLFKVFALCVRKKIDLLHCHLHEGALIGLCVGKLLNIPVIFDMHSSLEQELIEQRFVSVGGMKQKFARFFDRNLPKWVNYNIAISGNLLDYCRHINGCVKIEKVPNATDTDFFKPGESKLREKLQLSGHVVIGYQGNLSYLQNLELLVEAAVAIVKIEPQLRFLIGYTSDPKELEKLVTIQGLERSFVFVPAPYEKTPEIINCCDVMVVPRVEAFGVPMKLLNFMACGKPVVLHQDIAVSIIAGEHALSLHTFKGKAEFVEVLLRLVQDEELRNRGRDATIKFIHDEHSYENLWKRLRDIYEEVSKEKMSTVRQSPARDSEERFLVQK